MRAWLLRRTGRPAEAEALEGQLGEPRSATALLLSAAMRLNDDRIDAAEKRRALGLLSLATRIAGSPRLLLNVQWAAFAREVGDPVAKQESAESLLRLWPENPMALHYAATNLQDTRPERSAGLEQKAIDLGLEDSYAQYNLAAYLFKAGRHPDWIAPMRRHLELHPDGAARSMFLCMLLQRHELAMAREECDRWLREQPDDPEALRLGGQIASEAGEDARALELLRKAAQLAPRDVDCQYDLAVVTDTATLDAECRQQLAKVIALEPAHERAHKRLLGVLHDAADTAGVQAELERWLALKPEDAAAWTQLARTLVARNDPALLGPALSACERGDALQKGSSAEILLLKAQVLDALHCEGAAALCRERAQALNK
jgi:tetratricopeptide (TPR) repeat protein